MRNHIKKDINSVSNKLIQSIAEGLLAYRIFLSKCAVSSALSEYSFYEPLLRILNTKRDWIVRCEYPIPDNKKGQGDNKRIDFVIYNAGKNNNKPIILASLELKAFLSSGNPPKISQIVRDNNKLLDFQKIKEIGAHNSWILVLHNSGIKFKDKLNDVGLKSKRLPMKCVNKTYFIEIIKVQKYIFNK